MKFIQWLIYKIFNTTRHYDVFYCDLFHHGCCVNPKYLSENPREYKP